MIKNIYYVIVVSLALFLFIFNTNMVRACDASMDIMGEAILNVDLFSEDEIKEGIAELGSFDLKIDADKELEWRVIVKIIRSQTSIVNSPENSFDKFKECVEIWSVEQDKWIGDGDWIKEGKGSTTINNIGVRLNLNNYFDTENLRLKSGLYSIRIEYHLQTKEND